MKSVNKILRFILVILCVITIAVPVGFVVFFQYVFSTESEQPENYNPTKSFNSNYGINISDDVEVLYCVSNSFGWFGDGITYCVYNIGSDDIGVSWNEGKKVDFEEEVNYLTNLLIEDFKDKDECFALEYTFDWTKEYKWYCKYKLYNTNEYLDTPNVVPSYYRDGFFAFFVPFEQKLYCIEKNI